jgi:alkylation response protein AidB-like acyl-CoA dehydrogenase
VDNSNLENSMTFRAPVTDLARALRAAGCSQLAAHAFPDLDDETVEAILDAAGTFAMEILAPLNRSGDLEGARRVDGRTIAPSGFSEAYRQFSQQGWTSLSAEVRHGGQGLPKALELAVFEVFHAANPAFALCPMLTLGAIEALSLHGAPRQQALVLPKLVSGAWTGTMNLTEPQAGSDLSTLTTRADPDGQGGYRLTGEKTFISWGDHDMAENICHLVLARTPGAPPGVKGVSLFLATQIQVNDDGSLGERNTLGAASIEHKLGIHGSPTCVMVFDGAQAELVGELGQGLAHMFAMMNAARLQIGASGVGVAERAFQRALAYSQERRQGRSAWSAEVPAAIYDHPDVRRTLVLMKAKIAAARGVCLTTAVQADLATFAETSQDRASARARQELLTPIAKAWSTEVGVEVASSGVQIHGGMGFVEETGAAQHYRDARIGPIYEGANGIQAIDLVTRKIQRDQGAAMGLLCAEIDDLAAALIKAQEFSAVGRRLLAANAALRRATTWLLANPGEASLAAATPYLELCGDVIGGWALARQALGAPPTHPADRQGRISLLQVFASQVLTLSEGLAEAVCDGVGGLADIPHLGAH